jgi:DNA replication protein DnaC
VLAVRTEQMLKTLKQARLDQRYEVELRKLISVDPLVLDDFAIDVLDATESRDLYDILLERYRIGSIVVTSNRGLTNGSPPSRIRPVATARRQCRGACSFRERIRSHPPSAA